MDIHEYQAKDLFRFFGIQTLKAGLALSADQAESVARKIGGNLWAIKAQVHAGGRGKAGGIKLAKSLSEVRTAAAGIIGKTLVTPQTGKQGKVVHQVLVEQGLKIEKEFYLALLFNRDKARLSLVASPEGGVAIEEIAAKSPDKIFQTDLSFFFTYLNFQVWELLKFLRLSSSYFSALQDIIQKLCQLMQQREATLIEINPYALVTGDEGVSSLIPLDAKMSFDDNALFRQKELQALRDLRELPPAEQKALDHDLSFVELDGHIGCLVNGAGLAMATMDIVQLKGAKPANFLDVGGGVNAEKVDAAFRILKEDPSVKGILVNIFGGIVKCDLIAEGLVRAIRRLHIHLPVVVRLEGTRAKEAKEVLSHSGLDVHFASDLSSAAEKIITLTGGK